MKNWFKLSVLSISLFSFGAIACDLHGYSGFMPENNLYIAVRDIAAGGITEAQFNRVMDKMLALYSGEVAATGRTLSIERFWSDGTVNAYAHQNYVGEDTIGMFGGLARHPETTEDSMALVACHELGHHLGGAPKKPGATPGSFWWASNEGQADYWGTMKCLRHYFENDDNVAALKSLNIPTDVVTRCQLIYKNVDEVASCQRAAMAGLALGRLLNAVSDGKIPVSFTTPDSTIISSTLDSHPKAQCRLDTYYQATLCDHGFSERVSSTDPNTGVCSLRNGDKIGNRPLCWFKP